jgi:hypothetical protein
MCVYESAGRRVQWNTENEKSGWGSRKERVNVVYSRWGQKERKRYTARSAAAGQRERGSSGGGPPGLR